jgi:hypothetical protein
LVLDLVLVSRTSRSGRFTIAIQITGDTMTLEIDSRVVATARFGEYAAADGNGDPFVRDGVP